MDLGLQEQLRPLFLGFRSRQRTRPTGGKQLEKEHVGEKRRQYSHTHATRDCRKHGQDLQGHGRRKCKGALFCAATADAFWVTIKPCTTPGLRKKDKNDIDKNKKKMDTLQLMMYFIYVPVSCCHIPLALNFCNTITAELLGINDIILIFETFYLDLTQFHVLKVCLPFVQSCKAVEQMAFYVFILYYVLFLYIFFKLPYLWTYIEINP